MASDTLTFHCPSCSVRLTVPASLAGVKGPCPTCGSEIQAPDPAAVPDPVNPTAVETVEAAQVVEKPAPAVRPEPRQVPHRAPVEVVAKAMPPPAPDGSPAAEASPPLATNWFLRLVLLFVFLVAVVVVVFCVLTFVTNRQPPQIEPVYPKKTILPDESAPGGVPAAPVQPLPGTGPDQSAAIAPVDEGRSPAMASLEVLEKFLAARTLADRLPLMETRTPMTELAASKLAGPLPEATKLLTEAQETNPVERVTDIYFSVDFATGGPDGNPQTILVRTRGDAAPKVVADPFLDSFGGRLAAYAAQPQEKGGIFEVIAWPLASCNDESVPNREKKLTLKMLPRDGEPEIARAYFSRQSKIARMLEDGSYALTYGRAKACTVLLQWNTEERPETPYLEAVDVQRMDWNP